MSRQSENPALSPEAFMAMRVAVGGVPVYFSATALLKWRRAIGRMLGGEGYRPSLAASADSKGAGVGTDPTGQFRFATSVTVRLAQLLTSTGLTASSESMFGSAGTGLVPASIYDPRRSGFTGWTLYGGNGGDGGLGGEMVTTTTTNPGTFTPSVPVDRVRVLYKQGENSSTTATATVTADGGATLATLNGGSTPGYTKSPAISLGSLASHAISVTPAGTNPFYLAGMIAYNSAVPGIDVFNLGVSGVKAAYHATSQRLNWLNVLAPDLTIIDLGTNDMLLTGATDVTAWTASMQTIISKAKLTGDVVLIFPAIGRDGNSSAQSVLVTDAIRAPFRDALIVLAVVNDCVFIDEQAAFGGRDVAQSVGYFFDSLHENGAGTLAKARIRANVLAAAT